MFLKSVLTRTDINSELDELDREEFYRLKKVPKQSRSTTPMANTIKVKNNKQRDQEAVDKAEREKRERNDAGSSDKENQADEDGAGAGDILGEQEDQDVIF